MSKLKRILSLALAAAMVLSMSMVTFAAKTGDDEELIRAYPGGDFFETKLYQKVCEAAGVSTSGPLTVGDAKKVTSLDLSGLDISALTGLEYCVNLETLDLSGNADVADLSFLSGMSSLTTLDISGTAVADLSKLPTNITSLTMENCANAADLSRLSSLTSLEALDMSGCTKVNDLSNLPNSVTTLDVSNTAVRDLSKIPGKTALTSLSASGNNIENITSVADMTNLTTLDLSDNLISVVPSLTGLTSLSSLNLQGNNLTKDGIEKNLPDSITNNGSWADTVLGTTPAPSVNTTALKGAIEQAKDKMAGVVVSTDGFDVVNSKKWVTQSAMDTFTAAIAAAEAVLNNPTDQDTVNNAKSDLDNAITAFAPSSGTASYDNTELRSVIAEAEKLLADTKESTDGSDVAKDERWSSKSNRDTLQAAIDTAKGQLTTDADHAGDVATLRSAISAYNDTLAFGTKDSSTPTNPSKPSSGSSSSSNKRENPLDDWYGDISDMENASKGDVVKVNLAASNGKVPAALIQALNDSKATLQMTYGSTVYTIKPGDIKVDSGRLYWTVDEFLDLVKGLDKTSSTTNTSDSTSSTTSSDAKNPDTGANDLVGVATALAAVSLLGAAAVSLRK